MIISCKSAQLASTTVENPTMLTNNFDEVNSAAEHPLFNLFYYQCTECRQPLNKGIILIITTTT